MADDWIDDEGAYQEALEGCVDGEAGEVRYRLTPLGALALDEGRTFAGFGPCAASRGSVEAVSVTWRERPLERRRRGQTPLLG